MKRISFSNSLKPNSYFDLARYEEIQNRDHVDHSATDYHIIEFFAIILCDGGIGSHSIDFTTYECRKGTLLTIRKGQVHKFNDTSALNGSVLLFTTDFLTAYLEEMEAHKSMLLFNELLSSPKFELAAGDFTTVLQSIERISKEYLSVDDDFSPQIIRSELHILISKLFRIKARNQDLQVDKKYLKEFLELQQLAEELTFETNKVKDYAQRLGKSTKTLNTITRHIVHQSAKEFIDDVCTNRIKRLLINTKLSIKEIAYIAGFDETTNFYKYFKRQTQLTPEQYRARH